MSENRSLAWATTIAFYSGLHLVEAAFASEGSHCDDHATRNAKLRNERRFQNLWRHYSPLYSASLRARYLTSDGGSAEQQITASIGAEKVHEKIISHHLRELEKSVAKMLNIISIF